MRPHRSIPSILRFLAGAVVLALAATGLTGLLPPAPAGASDPRPIQLISRIGSTAVAEPSFRHGDETTPQGLSGDGRYVVFTTDSGTSLDGNGYPDVYLRDRRTGATEAVSVRSDGRTSEYGAFLPSISGDGRYVSFASRSRDLDGRDSGSDTDVFVRDRRAGTTRQVSREGDGAGTGSTVLKTQISADGRSVLWVSEYGVWVRRLPSGPIHRIITGSGWQASISGDGTYVVYAQEFGSTPVQRVHLTDRGIDRIDTVSTSASGAPRNAFDPHISASGQVVSFTSEATDLPPRGSGRRALYLRDLSPGGSYLVVVDAVVTNHVLSGNGRTVAFTTHDSLLPEDTDTANDVYASKPSGGLRLLTVDIDLATPDPAGVRGFWYPGLSADGLVATVVSTSTAGTGSAVAAPRTFALATQTLGDAMVDVSGAFSCIFGRPLTTNESSTRSAQIQSLARTSAEVIVDDLRRDSFSGPRAGVIRLYQAYFLRRPDTAGYDYWVAQQQAGVSLNQISAAFAASAEFRTTYGSLTNRQFVELVYMNVLGRPGDATGITYWTGQLDSRARNRGQVMTGFSESAEYRARTSLQVETIMVYRACRGSVPSLAYLDATERRRQVGLGITTELPFIFGG